MQFNSNLAQEIPEYLLLNNELNISEDEKKIFGDNWIYQEERFPLGCTMPIAAYAHIDRSEGLKVVEIDCLIQNERYYRIKLINFKEILWSIDLGTVTPEFVHTIAKLIATEKISFKLNKNIPYATCGHLRLKINSKSKRNCKINLYQNDNATLFYIRASSGKFLMVKVKKEAEKHLYYLVNCLIASTQTTTPHYANYSE